MISSIWRLGKTVQHGSAVGANGRTGAASLAHGRVDRDTGSVGVQQPRPVRAGLDAALAQGAQAVAHLGGQFAAPVSRLRARIRRQRCAAAPAVATVSGMLRGDRARPQAKTPSLIESTGRHFDSASLKKPSRSSSAPKASARSAGRLGTIPGGKHQQVGGDPDLAAQNGVNGLDHQGLTGFAASATAAAVVCRGTG